MTYRTSLFALLLLAPLAGALPAAHGATFVVRNLNDSGAGSLRAAIALANASPGADVVDASTQSGAINLLAPLPILTNTLEIRGAGADKLSVRRQSSAAFRLFSIDARASVSLSGLTISGGGGGLETGGAISSAGALSLSGCNLSGNAARRGGALFSTAPVTIDNCLFSGNSGIGGGAISMNFGHLSVVGSRFQGNAATADGGAIALSQTRATLERSSFTNNRADGNGGALFSSSQFDLSLLAVSATNCSLSGNRAGRGGAIWNSGGSLLLQNATVTDNVAATGTGVCDMGDAKTLTFLSGTLLAGNARTTFDVGDDATSVGAVNTFVSRGFNLVGGGNGRASFVKSGDRTGLTRDALKLGTVGSSGTFLTPLAGSPALDAIPAASLLVRVDERGASRPIGQGGDIGAIEADAPAPSSSLVVNSTADTSDGACSADNCTLREAVDAANALTANASAPTATISFAPKLFGTPQTISLVQSNFNQSGLFVTGRMNIVGPGATRLSIGAPDGCRQLEIAGTASVTLSGVTLSGGNPFAGRGGAILSAGTLDLADCTLQNNTAGGGAGGGIYSTGTLSLRACTLTGNSEGTSGFANLNPDTTFGGGAIYNGGALSVKDSTLSGNFDSAGDSGAIGTGSAGGGALFNAGTALIENSTLAGNGTSRAGGAILSRSARALSVVSCTLSNNSALNDIYGQTFGAGGGIHCEGQLVLRNSTLALNSVQNDLRSSGGGVWVNGAGSTIENCTITGNSSNSYPAGGVLVTGGTTTIKNTVIAANASDTVFPDVLAMGGSIVSGGYNFIGNGEGFNAPGDRAGGYPTPSSTQLVVLDARLGALANNGGPRQTIAPLADSPLINAGDPNFQASALPFDGRGPGFSRVLGARLDIGALETPGVVNQSIAKPSLIKPSAPVS